MQISLTALLYNWIFIRCPPSRMFTYHISKDSSFIKRILRVSSTVYLKVDIPPYSWPSIYAGSASVHTEEQMYFAILYKALEHSWILVSAGYPRTNTLVDTKGKFILTLENLSLHSISEFTWYPLIKRLNSNLCFSVLKVAFSYRKYSYK